MLVLHPSSFCDICMEDYEVDSLAKSPHAIDCGHILCRGCVSILSSDTSSCPLCRSDFGRRSVRKLFISAVSEGESTSTPSSIPAPDDAHVDFLLDKVDSVSEPGSSIGDVLAIITEAMIWLSEQPGAYEGNSLLTLQSAVLTLARLKLQDLEENRPAAEDLEVAHAVEQSLLSKLAEEQAVSQSLHHDFESKLHRAQDDIQTLQADNERLDTSLREQKAAMDDLRSEYDKCQREMAELAQSNERTEGDSDARVKDMEMKLTSKVVAAESEVVQLKAEVSRLRNASVIVRSEAPDTSDMLWPYECWPSFNSVSRVVAMTKSSPRVARPFQAVT